MKPARRAVVHRLADPGLAALHEPGTLGLAIDVLRATSTLTVARANGAAAIVPFARTADAIGLRERTRGVLACGEREGRIVPGFDLGNSPFEYGRERVAGRTLAFASTNGSSAMLALAGAGRRRLAAFINASAVVAACDSAPESTVRMVCAGKEGRAAEEDLACAAWIAARLAARGFVVELADGEDSGEFLAAAPADADRVRTCVENAEHGRQLASLGVSFAADVAFCATLDALDTCEGW